MDAEHGAERAELKPTSEELVIGGITRSIVIETTRICIPIGNAADRKIQPHSDLPRQSRKIAIDVTRPCDRRIALLSSPGRTRENEYAVCVVHRPLPIVRAGRVHQRIRVKYPRARTCGGGITVILTPVAAEFGFAGIQPPAINAQI